MPERIRPEITREKIVTVSPVHNEEKIEAFVDSVFEHAPNATTVLVVNNSTPEYEDRVKSIGRRIPNVIVMTLDLKGRTFAAAYQIGIERAIKHTHDMSHIIMEIDSNFGHPAWQIPKFVEPLEENDTYDMVFSSRFSHGGKSHYPYSRRLISYMGTVGVNLMLGERPIPPRYPDMTSGFESFRAEAINRLFAKYPPDDWISIFDGPPRLFQSELRSYAVKMDMRILWDGLEHGEHRDGEADAIPMRTIVKSWEGLWKIGQRINS